MNKRIRYTFAGSVQGVGFRFTAYRTARLLGLTGWVRNEFDGSVTMEVQGRKHDISDMLETIEQSAYIRISDLNSKELPLDREEKSFEIRN